jgi:F-type H+-transporting ATPase subunit b
MIHHLLADAEFWVLIAAALFVVAVWKPASRLITGGLDARAARIRTELDEARRLREEAEQLVADYRAKEREAKAEAETIVAHAQAEAERIAAQSARDLELALERRQRMAEERIAQAEAKALDEVRAAAIDVAIAAARDVIRAEIDEHRGSALLDAAIVALPQRLR